MPGDFGDESGEKLFDWMLHIGERLSEEAMHDAAQKLVSALRHARSGIKAEQADDAGTVVRLNMDEFKEIPEYDSIKAIIDERLSRESVKHEFAEIYGTEYLLFRAEDARTVSSVFEELELSVEENLDRAVKDIEMRRGEQNHDGKEQRPDAFDDRVASRDEKENPEEKSSKGERASDSEPLDVRASRAKKTARSLEKTRGLEHEINPVEVRSK